MALSIENPETERLARALARVTGESLTEAVTKALRERLVREAGHKGDREQIRAEIRRIQQEVLVHRGNEGYEVEFITLDGETITVVTLLASQVRAIEEREIANARKLSAA